MPMPGPIGLMMRQKAGRRPPMPPMMDEQDPMAMMPPDMGDGMDFDGVTGPAEVQGGAPFPVHDTGQMQGEYKRMGMRPTPEVNAMTQGMEQSPPGPIREKFHAAQHQRMRGDQNSVNQQLRMDLANKKAMIEQRILQMQRGGDLKSAQRLQQMLQALGGQLDSAMQDPGMGQ